MNIVCHYDMIRLTVSLICKRNMSREGLFLHYGVEGIQMSGTPLGYAPEDFTCCN